MYFSKASSTTKLVANTHDEIRRTVPGLDGQVVKALFGESTGGQYSDISWGIHAGKSLLSGDFVGTGWSILKSKAISPAISVAVNGFVTSAWYSLKYPIVGGALQWSTTLPLVGSKIAAYFGPPAALVSAASFGATLAVLVPLNHGVKGLKSTYDRKKEIDFANVAIPVVVATAESDGSISVEELRILHDLIQQIPPSDGFNPRQKIEELIGSNAKQIALESARSVKLDKKKRKRVLTLAMMTAFADNNFNINEKHFVSSLAEELKLSDEYPELAKELSKKLELELHLAEANVRLLHAIALTDGHINEDAAELIDMILMSTVGPEVVRKKIVANLRNENTPKVFTKHQFIQPIPKDEKRILAKIRPDNDVLDRSYAIDYVTAQGIAFIHALETIRRHKLPRHREQLVLLLRAYDVLPEDIEKHRENYLKETKKSEKASKTLIEDTGKSTCPYCKSVGSFELSEQCYLTRNEYQCQNCKRKAVLCRFPNCTDMTSTGDFWNNEFCDKHFSLPKIIS